MHNVADVLSTSGKSNKNYFSPYVMLREATIILKIQTKISDKRDVLLIWY